MKVCDKCKGKSESAKKFGADRKAVFEGVVLDLCQDCFFESYHAITGKEFLDMEDNGGRTVKGVKEVRGFSFYR